METIYYNQFQSVYEIYDYYFVIDFLHNNIKKYNKKDFLLVYRFNNDSQIKCDILDSKIKNRNSHILDITIITDFACNMKCLYCFEHSFTSKVISNKLNPVLIINFIKEMLDKYNYKLLRINISGGEPLLPYNIEYLDKLCLIIRSLNVPTEFHLTTNGLNIVDFIDNIQKWDIEDIQITLDGTEKFQNTRRAPVSLINGFEKITTGITSLLNLGIQVSLRVNVDKNNVSNLPELAKFIISQGWLNKSCQTYLYPITYSGNPDYLLTDSELDIFKQVLFIMRNQSPEVKNVFSYDFHGIDYLNNLLIGKMPVIRNRYCGFSMGQYVLLNNGHIYSCWWGVNNQDFCIGNITETDITLNEQKINAISQRTVQNMPLCNKCKFKYLCGGGCAFKEWVNFGTTNQGNCAEFDLLFNEYLHYFYYEESKL